MEATGDDQSTVVVAPGEGRTLLVRVIACGNFVADFVCPWEPGFAGEGNETAGGIIVVNYFFPISTPGGGGGFNTWLFAPSNLPRSLAFSGVMAASFAINYDSFPLERLRSDELLSVAYGLARFVLFFSGVGLMVLSARASCNLGRHAALPKAAMSATLLLLAAGPTYEELQHILPAIWGLCSHTTSSAVLSCAC